MKPLRVPVGAYTFDAVQAGRDDAPLVLLLHGWPEFADVWSAVLPRLAAAGYRAVALEQRGYSPDARPQRVEDYRLSLLAADALAVADELGADRFHVVGHDWGAIVAWAVAGWHPDRLHSITVVSTPHPRALFDPTDTDQVARLDYVGLLRAPIGTAERVLLAEDARRLRALYAGKVDAVRVESTIARLALPGALRATVNWYREPEDTFDMGVDEIDVPTLYLWGSADAALGPTAAYATQHWVRAPYRFVEVDGGSHWLPDERPAVITEHLLAHLAGYSEVG